MRGRVTVHGGDGRDTPPLAIAQTKGVEPVTLETRIGSGQCGFSFYSAGFLAVGGTIPLSRR